MMLTLSSDICCPACGNKKTFQLEKINLELQHALYAPNNTLAQKTLTKEASLSADRYTMHKCACCELEYAKPLVAPNSAWYSFAYNLLALYPLERWEFDYVINQLTFTDSVGEIGCGSGTFLKKCQTKGIKCHGLDFSADAINLCITNGLSASLFDVINDEFDQDTKKSFIVSFHVLEHLDDPSGLFKLARRWSVDNAVLWVAVPSDRRPTRHFNETDFLDQPPHHLTRWNLHSLKDIGSANGWKLDRVSYEPISFQAIVWHYSTRTTLYKFFQNRINVKNCWLERLVRAVVYPIAVLKWLLNKQKMTGFSMLARYSKYETTH